MRVSLVNHLEAEVSTVEHIGPSVDYMALAVLNRLVEVETIPRFLHSFLSEWGGLYLHPRGMSGAVGVLHLTLEKPPSL